MRIAILVGTVLVVAGVCGAVPKPILPSLTKQEAPVAEAEDESTVVRHKRQDDASNSGGSLDIPPPVDQDPSAAPPTLPPIPSPKKPTTTPPPPPPPTTTTERPTEPPPPPPEPEIPKEEPRPSGRQLDGEQSTEDLCDFGSLPEVNLCDWSNLNVTQLQWVPSAGQNAFWVGGPQEDVSYGDGLGGFAVFETSQMPQRASQGPTFDSAMLMSPVRGTTGASGMCVRFWYSIGGLSPDKIRVLLHPMPDDMKTNDDVDEMMRGYDGSEDVVLWQARDLTMGDWKEGQVVYTYDKPHSVIFEAIPLDSADLNRNYRGFIAVDELSFTESSQCGAFCTFEGGTCGWSQDENDNFDWKQSRGSENPSTGPRRDRSSFESNDMMGGYAYIDSSYPRRPGDRARLMSQEFQGTNPNSPLCMRFWTHMYGNGIGSLRVLLFDVNEEKDMVIWSISGEAGNAWYQGQVPIASPSPFKIVFEGVVGNNNLGDIAIDEISIVQGACPTAPQVASADKGDCTFEVDECGWTNPGPRFRLDEMNWVRTVAGDNRAPTRDHSLGTPQGYYIALPRGSVQRGGDRAWFLSDTIPPTEGPLCVAFWYFMYEPFIDTSGPSLGSLVLYRRQVSGEETVGLDSVWSLKNHQGPNWLYGQAKVESDKDFQLAFEGTWGSSRGNGFIALDDITFFDGDCSTMPEKAATMSLDCDFQRFVCQWTNTTTDEDFRWTTASISRRPANLPDHTFSGPIGYAYFDVFNQNARPQTLTLTSPIMDKTEDNAPMCLGFWYAYFGAGDSTKLMVHRESYDKNAEEGQESSPPVELWSLNAGDVGTQRPEWTYGQVQVDTSSDYRVSFVGMASNGGFAIDDLQSYPGECEVRPAEGTPDANELTGPN